MPRGGRGRARARGHQQRARARRALEGRTDLFKYLVEQWAWGLFTATVVQTVAMGVVKAHAIDGVPQSPDDIVALSNLGAQGNSPQHCHSQLVNLLGLAFTIVPSFFLCPLLTLKKRLGMRIVTESKHAMVNPFQYFSFLWNEERERISHRNS